MTRHKMQAMIGRPGWQIVPRRFMELIADDNPKMVQAVMDAMMPMVKLDIAALEEA